MAGTQLAPRAKTHLHLLYDDSLTAPNSWATEENSWEHPGLDSPVQVLPRHMFLPYGQQCSSATSEPKTGQFQGKSPQRPTMSSQASEVTSLGERKSFLPADAITSPAHSAAAAGGNGAQPPLQAAVMHSSGEMKQGRSDHHQPSTSSVAGSPGGRGRRGCGVPASLFDQFMVDVSEKGRLGSGQYGVVRKCLHLTTGEAFACKSVAKASLQTPRQALALSQEISLGAALSRGHPNIVTQVASFEDASHVHMVMALCSGGDLFSLVSKAGRLTELQATYLFRKIVSAVSFCHASGVIHRDIKPENILLSLDHEAGQIEPQLADFGLAVVVGQNESPEGAARGIAGSPFYMAPEVIMGAPYGSPADIWSAGVLLYIMLSGLMPFCGDSIMSTFSSICSQHPDLSSAPWDSISPSARALILSMLNKEPGARPTAEGVLTHPWLLAFGPPQPRARSAAVKTASSQTVSMPQAPACRNPKVTTAVSEEGYSSCVGGTASQAAPGVAKMVLQRHIDATILTNQTANPHQRASRAPGGAGQSVYAHPPSTAMQPAQERAERAHSRVNIPECPAFVATHTSIHPACFLGSTPKSKRPGSLVTLSPGKKRCFACCA